MSRGRAGAPSRVFVDASQSQLKSSEVECRRRRRTLHPPLEIFIREDGQFDVHSSTSGHCSDKCDLLNLSQSTTNKYM